MYYAWRFLELGRVVKVICLVMLSVTPGVHDYFVLKKMVVARVL